MNWYSPRVGAGLCLLVLPLLAMSAVLVTINWDTPTRESLSARVGGPIVALAFAICAGLVTTRQPRNPFGWLLLAAAFALATYGVAYEYAVRAVIFKPGSLPGGELVAWLYGWVWVPLLTMIAPGLALFPDGKLPSRRWRPLVWLSIAVLAIFLVRAATHPGPLLDEAYVQNPFALGSESGVLDTAAFMALFVLIFANAAAPIARFRHAGGVERQQLKWLVLSGMAFAVAFPALVFGDSAGQAVRYSTDAAFFLALLSLPLSITLAILRYGLYDIDRIINRTLSYGLLTAGLGGTYFALVVALQTLLRPVSGGSDLAIIVTTLVIAALILPARRRLQSAVDRRFSRRTYDAARTIDAFNARLRQQIDLDTLHRELHAVVDETMQPAGASLWLRNRNDFGSP